MPNLYRSSRYQKSPKSSKSPQNTPNPPKATPGLHPGFGVLTVTAACPNCAQPYRSSSRWILPTLQRISRSPLASAGPSVPCRSLMGVTDASPGHWGPPSVVGSSPKHVGFTRDRGAEGCGNGFGSGHGLVDPKVSWTSRFGGPKSFGGP